MSKWVVSIIGPSTGTTQMSAEEGLRVRPETVVGEERVRERHDSSVEPAVTDETETATHCIVASSVNNSIPL